jgi:MFS family permease
MGVIGGVLAGIIIKDLPYPRNFATLFFIAFVGVSISWLFLSMNKEPHIKKETVETVEKNHYFKRLKGILSKDGNFRNYLISRGLAYAGLMAQGFIAVYVIQHFDLSEDYAGIFTAILLGSGAIGFAIWGIMGDRVGYKRVMMISILIRIAVLILFIFSPSLVWIYIAFGLMGIGNTASMTSDFNITMEFGSESERPTYIGLARTLTGPVLLIAPLAAGVIVELWGYPAMFLVSLVFTLIGFVMLWLGVKEPRNVEVRV